MLPSRVVSGFSDVRGWVDFIVSKRDMIFSLMENNDCSLTPATDDQRSLPDSNRKVRQQNFRVCQPVPVAQEICFITPVCLDKMYIK